MKRLDNHLYSLIAHVIVLTFIQFSNFSILGIISIICSIGFLLIATKLRKYFTVYYFIQLILYSLIPFCYFTNNLVSKVIFDYMSIFDILLVILVFFIAIKITKSRKESYINVYHKYTEEKSVRKKANIFASRLLYFIILPLFLLIFFFEWHLKLIFTLTLITIVSIIIYAYTDYIGRRELAMRKR